MLDGRFKEAQPRMRKEMKKRRKDRPEDRRVPLGDSRIATESRSASFEHFDSGQFVFTSMCKLFSEQRLKGEELMSKE